MTVNRVRGVSRTLGIFTACMIAIGAAVPASAMPGLFSPVPAAVDDDPSSKEPKWEWRPHVTIPAIKIVESTRAGANLDAQLLASSGGGLSYQLLEWHDDEKKWKSKWSWSPLTVLLSGNVNEENSRLDIAFAGTFGAFNNLLMMGLGYDAGDVGGRSRLFGLLSVGINFNG